MKLEFERQLLHHLHHSPGRHQSVADLFQFLIRRLEEEVAMSHRQIQNQWLHQSREFPQQKINEFVILVML